MNCRDTISQISNFLDEDLEPGLAEALKKHLASCPDCSVVFDTTRRTIELFCGTEPLPLPGDVEARLQEALARKIKPRPASA